MNTEIDNYPIKRACEMSNEELSRWWAFVQALDIIFTHAEKYDLDIDKMPLNTKKILDEYIDPISGDILHELNKEQSYDLYSGR
jgi:hypothetical protein